MCSFLLAFTTKLFNITGAQALVAWSLSRAFPDVRLQMVAEEDSADLRHA